MSCMARAVRSTPGVEAQRDILGALDTNFSRRVAASWIVAAHSHCESALPTAEAPATAAANGPDFLSMIALMKTITLEDGGLQAEVMSAVLVVLQPRQVLAGSQRPGGSKWPSGSARNALA